MIFLLVSQDLLSSTLAISGRRHELSLDLGKKIFVDIYSSEIKSPECHGDVGD